MSFELTERKAENISYYIIKQKLFMPRVILFIVITFYTFTLK